MSEPDFYFLYFLSAFVFESEFLIQTSHYRSSGGGSEQSSGSSRESGILH